MKLSNAVHNILSLVDLNVYLPARRILLCSNCISAMCRPISGTSGAGSGDSIQKTFRKVMGKVPQPVVVVTTARRAEDGTWLKRGVTCSSFTSVSMKPPVLSFCINKPSRMNDLLMQTNKFAVHVLAKDQAKYGLHFSKQTKNGNDQFKTVPHVQDNEGIPIIEGVNSVLQCQAHVVNLIGDHSVWYGEVLKATVSQHVEEPLLYYARSFRQIGDEAFMQAFEDQSLPFEDWTHEAHLRMAWNYIKEHGKEDAVPYVRQGIMRYNERNKDKVSRGYHETITMFYIHMVSDAVQRYDSPDITFQEFITTNSYLTAGELPFQYYSRGKISSEEAAAQFVQPDIQALP